MSIRVLLCLTMLLVALPTASHALQCSVILPADGKIEFQGGENDKTRDKLKDGLTVYKDASNAEGIEWAFVSDFRGMPFGYVNSKYLKCEPVDDTVHEYPLVFTFADLMQLGLDYRSEYEGKTVGQMEAKCLMSALA